MEDVPVICWPIVFLIVAIVLGRAWMQMKIQIAMIQSFDWRGLISFLQGAVLILGAVITIALVLDGVPGDEVASLLVTLGLGGFFQVIKPGKKSKEIEDEK